MSLRSLILDRSWTLFLDRDGVINDKLPGDYVKCWEEFHFLPGVKEAIKIFARKFKHIIIVTNQQGIGKGIMTEEQLELIHSRMKKEIIEAGGSISSIYFSPYLDSDNHPSRKPGTGMAEMAKTDFPKIHYKKSIIAGDSPTDIEFGRKAGMYTVFINKHADGGNDEIPADLSFSSLIEFANFLNE